MSSRLFDFNLLPFTVHRSPLTGVTMKCPFCGYEESKVLDSRTSKEMDSIRRRRECLKCQKRFTTLETIEASLPLVVKRDGRREPFEPTKILNGLKKACEKRPVAIANLERILSRIEYALETVMGLISSSSATWRTDGKNVPGASFPVAICVLT